MEKELLDALRKLKERGVSTFIAKVVSVNKQLGTCIVNDGELDYSDVQLSAIADGNQNNFHLFPKLNSWVLVSPINEDVHRLYVELYSEIESVELIIDSVVFKVDNSGFLLKKENETLKALMEDLIGAIKQMSFTVTTPSGLGATTTLNNLPAFTAIETRFNQFLKDS